ncbi:PAS domain-containing protein [Octadecabacter sp. G9-8]|uniref:PAS domain-containing protein n=1 Tax=Octadecabacter dasysiphoniae TaxID=2909341 RepID=A0ABS9CUU3_9RHOB|nr:PAS domain-containing protein [Octadecabacter dasysiphoniae]MCF2870701.1 PAS domain-containing protein [Octadecabacter dasysiphoniae]
MSFTFDPYKLRAGDVTEAQDVLMTNPTALNEMERYWASLPRTRGVPLRKDVDPAQMGGLLEDSFILERVAPGVARIRVAGRNIAKLIGIEPRGLPLTAAFLPEARAEVGQYLEKAFTSPGLVELALSSPRAVGQPKLHGKILMLPLRDDHGRVSRIMGVLVMSGRRGMGGRRFALSKEIPARFEPTVGLQVVPNIPTATTRPSLRSVATGPDSKKAGDMPALRLVVSNS